MGSPINSWEGASAVFTGAHSTLEILLFLLIVAILTLIPLVDSAKHEAHAYKENAGA